MIMEWQIKRFEQYTEPKHFCIECLLSYVHMMSISVWTRIYKATFDFYGSFVF